LRILVARDELSDLLEDVFTLIQTLGEESVGPLVRDEPQVANRQVDQLIHQVHVQHTLLTHVQVQLDLAQALDVQFEGFRQALEPLAAPGLALFAETCLDPADVHCAAVDVVIHLLEEFELLLHLHQVIFRALLHAREGGLLHRQHVGLIFFDCFLQHLATGILVPLQELNKP